jgi:hypothetical protein
MKESAGNMTTAETRQQKNGNDINKIDSGRIMRCFSDWFDDIR